MIKIAIVLIGTLLNSTQAQDIGKRQVGGPVLGKYQRIVTDESIKNRENKRFQLTASFLGGAFESRASSLELGYFLSINEVASFEYRYLDGDSAEHDESGEGFSLNVSYKKFVSNSFYIKPQLYYRSQNIRTYTFSTTPFFRTEEYSEKFKDLGVMFVIGNQWQWENFTLGCDWLGLGGPVIITNDPDGYDYPELSASVLNFYLGLSF